MIRRPPRSTRVRSSAASDVYKRQPSESPRGCTTWQPVPQGCTGYDSRQCCRSAARSSRGGGLLRPPFVWRVGEFWVCPALKKFLKIPLPLPYQSAGTCEDVKLHKMPRNCNSSVAITCFLWRFGKCQDPDLNWGHGDFQSPALPTELSRLAACATTQS